jgi:hypothetical protein
MNNLKQLLLFFCGVLLMQYQLQAQAVKVAVQYTPSIGYQLIRADKPYYVKGVGGEVFLDEAVQTGANTLRLWGPEHAKTVLDEAQKRGLTVMLGLWMVPERHGFDYSDTWACEDQLAQFKSIVNAYKNHPALLLWGVGNEVDLAYTNYDVWKAVEKIAAMIHTEDPNHPTCVVTAGIDVAEVKLIQKHCPSIDILGVNTYGDIETLPEQIKLYGWQKPYLVTEWGPNGHWEVTKTSWGSPIEQTSTEKAAVFRNRYLNKIAVDSMQCMGSFAFLWGQKQETTPTWYGLFVDNNKTESVQVLENIWTGKQAQNPIVQILAFTLNGFKPSENYSTQRGKKINIQLLTSKSLKDYEIKWELLPESIYTKSGGDAELKPEAIAVKLKQLNETSFEMKAPFNSGAYRLFVYIKDPYNQIAYANFPFLVK